MKRFLMPAIIAAFILMIGLPIFGQTTIFNETVGTPSATTAINTYTGWSNNATLTFTGSGDVRTSTPSSGYTGASGSGNVFLTTGGTTNFQIANINTSGYTSLALSFGNYKSTTTSNGSELTVQVSSDGTNYTNLTASTLPTGTGTATWSLRTATGTIPSTSNLRIRFINTSTTTPTTQFRLDDIKLTGTVVTPAPNLTINDVTVTEGNAGTTTAAFTVSLSSPAPAGGVTFDITTADGTATAPSDYTAKTLTGQTIPAGSSTYQFTVSVNGDTVAEANETFFVNVTNVTGATVTDGQGQGTITNDDAITLSPTTLPNGTVNAAYSQTITANGGTAPYTFTVTAGALPNGLTLTTGGVLSGTPATAGTFNFTVTATDANNFTGSQAYTVTIIAPDTIAPTITYTPLPAKANAGTSVLSVTATDNVGVTGVSIVYAIGSGAPQTAACVATGATTYDCTIDDSSGGGFGVSYYVTATDAAGNSSRNPAGTNVNGYNIGSASIQAGTYTTLNVNGGTLTGNVIVTGSMSFNGLINSNGNTLTIGCGATLTGGSANAYVSGSVQKNFCTVGETFMYPVGTAPPPPTFNSPNAIASIGYTPLTVNPTAVSGTASLTVLAVDGVLPGANTTAALTRYWTLTRDTTGSTLTADLTFSYNDTDVVGDETTYKVLKREAGTTTIVTGGTVNAAANTFSVAGVSSFSDWSAGVPAGPTAASSNISGAVRTANGRGIQNALVMVSGSGLQNPVYARTSTFGNFTVKNLPSGGTYVISVISKGYTFSNPSRVISLNDDFTNFDFIADSK